MTATPLSRSRVLARIEGRIRRFASPRLQMAVMVAGTGVAGFFASVLLLHLGLHALWLRYGLAVGVAYVVFLLMILGAVLHAVAPKAVSLGEVWKHVTGSPPGSTAAR